MKLLTALVRWLIGEEEARLLLGDLEELRSLRAARTGERSARRWFIRHALASALRIRLHDALTRRPATSSTRTMRVSPLRDLPRSLRITLRSLRARPGFAFAVSATLALGLAGVCVVFALANWVLLRPVPGVRDPESLVLVQYEAKGGGPVGGSMPISQPDAADLAQRAARFGELTASTPQDLHFATAAGMDAERIPGAIVWPNYFEVLGMQMLAGRTLRADSLDSVVVVSDRLARRIWQRTVDAIGAPVFINGSQYSVIGVAAAGFHGADLSGSAELWLPASALPSVLHSPQILGDGTNQVWPQLILRPHADVSSQQIADLFNAALPAIRESGRAHSFWSLLFSFRAYDGIGIEPGLRAGVSRTLQLLAGATLLLLLLTCANVSSLALTRSASHATSAAIQRALGANGRRIVFERMLEIVLLAVGGALLATGISAIALRVLGSTSLARGGVPLDGVQLSGSVLFVTFVAALAAGILTGLPAAIALARTSGTSLFRATRHGNPAAERVCGALVVLQVAVSIVLVVGCTLLGRTLWNLQHVDLGFEQDNVLTFSLDTELNGYTTERTDRFLRELESQLNAIPGVRASAITDHSIFAGFYFPALIPRPTDGPKDRALSTRRWQTSPALLDVLGIPLAAGSMFRTDWLSRDSTAQRVGLLNEAAARVIFPGERPEHLVGRTITVRGTRQPVIVSGIARDARLSSVMEPPEPYFFQPWGQGWKVGQFVVYVRAHAIDAALRQRIREVVRRLDPGLPVYGLHSLREEVAEQTMEQRFIARLALSIAITGITLALIGLYGMLSYTVLERTRELGLRAALGADRRSQLELILTRGLGLASAGIVIGLAGALYFSRFLQGRLYGVKPFDGQAYLLGVLLLVIVAMVASAIPGWRAARVEPMDALRQ
ncbi:MAG: ABC transporter permease [Gemmatimonadota bacterium]